MGVWPLPYTQTGMPKVGQCKLKPVLLEYCERLLSALKRRI